MNSSRRRRAGLRMAIELTVCLLVLVTLFRTFLASGYMIETGSMAPGLVGYHWRATCPGCRYTFAVEGSRTGRAATCPNCGRAGISVENLSRNDGDHMLVHRGAFDLRSPKRWEAVVFRNPNKPTQAYVKRLIGLPGETVAIREGDIYINGQLQAKPFGAQRGMRILVFDNDFCPEPDDPDWRPRWVPDEPENGWRAAAGTFRFSKPDQSGAGESSVDVTRWVSYRHWIRHGGAHKTSVRIPRWPEQVSYPETATGTLVYNRDQQTLVCRGCLPREMRDRLLGATTDALFRGGIERLYEASHVAPITDRYGYNRGADGGGDNEVRDLMLAACVSAGGSTGSFHLELSDGTETLQLVFDLADRRARLLDTRTGKSVRTVDLPAAMLQMPAVVEFSLMDRQALAAVDGKLLFAPWSYPAGVERGPTAWQPARIGAQGGIFQVEHLQLYRDVYYTGGEGTPAEGWRLQPDEFFVLGDNSPQSRDSRSWDKQASLQGTLFLGKPVVVHLPSRQARLRIGKWETEIRIPELSRMRYIH